MKTYYFQILVYLHMASSHSGQNKLQGLQGARKNGMPVGAINSEASS